jgi:hypothetical protein
MNSKELLSWLKAAQDCRPSLSVDPVRTWVRRLPKNDWRFEIGLTAPALWERLEIQVFAPSAEAADALRRSLKLPDLANAPGWPAAGAAWSWTSGVQEGSWAWEIDANDVRTRVEKSGVRHVLRATDWTKELLSDPALAAALGEAAAACPIRELATERPLGESGRTPSQDLSWSLRLKPSLPWPSFARLSLAQPFVAQSALLAYLLLDRRVSQVSFRGEGMTVYLGA